MKKTKLEKGITLIALIITIVVLLILAVVTIGAIQESKIIGHSQKAASEYKIAQEKEQIGIGYSEYIIEKNTTQNAQLKVNGAQVTPVGNTGWEVVFSETNSKYQVDKSGTITYIEEGEENADIAIAAEKDLNVAMYLYGRVYNSEKPGIIYINPTFFNDEDNNRISDNNPNLGAYYEGDTFHIPVSFFEKDVPTEGNIEAKITLLDGTEEEIILTTTDNKKWTYGSLEESLVENTSTEISFRPYATWMNLSPQFEDSTEYHLFNCSEGIYKLEMLDKTIEFSYNCQAIIGIMDMETGETKEPMYNNIEDVSKIIVNFSDNSNRIYAQENLFDASKYMGEFAPSTSTEIPILYMNGALIINMPEFGLKNPITSVIVEENGVATKYNVSGSTMVTHMRPGT